MPVNPASPFNKPLPKSTRQGLFVLCKTYVAKKSVLLYTCVMQNDAIKYYGFDPVFDGNSRVLILGSFPSVKSREQAFYYGNKQNRFWRILSEFYGGAVETVEDKTALCLTNGVGLWDIVTSCNIVGSLDSDIKDYALADLSAVLNGCDIVKILCNGAKAYQLTKRAYDGKIPVVKLPSTSSANIRFDKTVWFDNLRLDKEN